MGDRSDGTSLAVRLMQIAGEYELDRKREKQRLESKGMFTTDVSSSLPRSLPHLHSSLQSRHSWMQTPTLSMLIVCSNKILKIQIDV